MSAQVYLVIVFQCLIQMSISSGFSILSPIIYLCQIYWFYRLHNEYINYIYKMSKITKKVNLNKKPQNTSRFRICCLTVVPYIYQMLSLFTMFPLTMLYWIKIVSLFDGYTFLSLNDNTIFKKTWQYRKMCKANDKSTRGSDSIGFC